ncbi:YsnF/AvaK domain-containing protein [Siminovitchia sp. 179-K 8D1 HS]|uniref:YsnF/AvaK domain-containing protein n=1 Tax=Siminovitchia sp. 179-K 8D1 HS TaxID=3142385 RepID=UPI0039A01F6C
MDKKVVGVFHSEEEAIRKIDELEAQGYDASDIYAVAQDENDISMVRGQTNVDVRSAGGNWFDRFVGFLTGEEPVREAMRNMGLSGSDMDRYYQEIEDGGILLYVDKEYGERYSANSRYADAEPQDAKLHTEANAVPHTDGADFPSDPPEGTVEDETRMKLHEEKLEVDKKEVQSGEVTVRKDVVEEEQTIDVPVSREEVYIERRPVGEQEAADEASAAFDGDEKTIRIPLKSERLDVRKKPVVNDEIIVGKKEVEDTETVKETIRREKADIDRTGDCMMKGKDHQDGMANREASDGIHQMKMNHNGTFRNQNGMEAEASETEDEMGLIADKQNKMERELEKRRSFLQADDDHPYTGNERSSRF